MMTGSDGVSFLLPQLFLSQHRLREGERRRKDVLDTDTGRGVQNRSTMRQRKSQKHYGKEEEDFEGVRLLIGIVVGSRK